MKRFSVLPLLLGYCVASQATILAYTPNVVGGYTMLTDEYCSTNDDYLQAYASDSKNNISKACWYVEKDFVYFIPNNGKIRRLPIDQFNIMPTPEKKKVKQGSKVNV
jgi:hypothetical protein